jgi:hypothetical protein
MITEGGRFYYERLDEIVEHFHLNKDKFVGQQLRKKGEHYRSITAKFSDKEMEEAMKIGVRIKDCLEPQDGCSYEEIATMLWGDKYLEDDKYVSRVDRLLYILQAIILEICYNSPGEEDKMEGVIRIMPYVKSTKKTRIKEYDEPIKVIFNAAANREYGLEALKEFRLTERLKGDDYIIELEIPCLSKEEREWKLVEDNLKGLGNQDVYEYLDRLKPLIDRIHDILFSLGPMPDNDLMNKVMPESAGKDLEPYKTKFCDAMYMWFKLIEHSKHRKVVERFQERWEKSHGYLEQTTLDNLKGVGSQDMRTYLEELLPLAERITTMVSNLEYDDIFQSLDRVRSEVMPESKGKSGKDLEPYRLKFNDAVYINLKRSERGKHKEEAERDHDSWKREHGYFEENFTRPHEGWGR